MKKWILLFCWLVPCSLFAMPDLKLGIDQPEIYGPILTGKRVALVVNQSSVSSQGEHTIDKLLSEQQQYHFNIVALFSVEHGLRGDKEAGLGDDPHRDQATGLPIIPLYGKDESGKLRRNPSPEMLDNIDIIIYDLQDVGVRFYTYTTNLHYLLDSLQQQNKELMILDRPNPLGDVIYGPILKEENISSIGLDPIPMVHGLTSGEFALMIVHEQWLTHFDYQTWKNHNQSRWQFSSDKLHIIKMNGYYHDDVYSLTIPPSPNLRSNRAIQLYPSLALFEATSVNTGRGSDYPFEQLGFSDPNFYINTRYDVDPSIEKNGWPQAGKTVYGERFFEASHSPTFYYFIQWAYLFHNNGYRIMSSLSEESAYLKHQESTFISRPSWLNKLVGDSQFASLLNNSIQKNLTVDETLMLIESSWQNELARYKQLKEKYRLYPNRSVLLTP